MAEYFDRVVDVPLSPYRLRVSSTKYLTFRSCLQVQVPRVSWRKNTIRTTQSLSSLSFFRVRFVSPVVGVMLWRALRDDLKFNMSERPQEPSVVLMVLIRRALTNQRTMVMRSQAQQLILRLCRRVSLSSASASEFAPTFPYMEGVTSLARLRVWSIGKSGQACTGAFAADRTGDTVTHTLCSVASKYDLFCNVYFGNRRSTKSMHDQTVRRGLRSFQQ